MQFEQITHNEINNQNGKVAKDKYEFKTAREIEIQ